MNPEALLALISDLYLQVAQLRQTVTERDQKIAQLEQAAKPSG